MKVLLSSVYLEKKIFSFLAFEHLKINHTIFFKKRNQEEKVMMGELTFLIQRYSIKGPTHFEQLFH